MQKYHHPKVTPVGKAENLMRNAWLQHSHKHEGKGQTEKIDLLPEHKKKS